MGRRERRETQHDQDGGKRRDREHAGKHHDVEFGQKQRVSDRLARDLLSDHRRRGENGRSNCGLIPRMRAVLSHQNPSSIDRRSAARAAKEPS